MESASTRRRAGSELDAGDHSSTASSIYTRQQDPGSLSASSFGNPSSSRTFAGSTPNTSLSGHAATTNSKRFMAVGGGQLTGNPSGTRIGLALGPSGRSSAQNPNPNSGVTPASPPSRYLITVLPPPHLPHDPPHPRTSSHCTGYGPPSKFRRGTLIPLYPTLGGQLAAIAREYGLPSTGGLVVYLVELNAANSSPNNEALVGGPRIGDEAWNLLWGQLFEDDLGFSEEEDSLDASDADGHGILPPIPPHIKNIHHGMRSQTPSEPSSDVSSFADNSSAYAMDDGSHSQSQASNLHGKIPSPSTTRFPHSSNGPQNDLNYQTMANNSRTRPQSVSSRVRSRQQMHSVRGQTSRHSLAMNRSYPASLMSVTEGPAYGEAVIVGKLEFDIDNRRGAGRWFDSWLESAHSNTFNNYTGISPLATPGIASRSLPLEVSQNPFLRREVVQETAPHHRASPSVIKEMFASARRISPTIGSALQMHQTHQSIDSQTSQLAQSRHVREESLVPQTQDVLVPTHLSRQLPPTSPTPEEVTQPFNEQRQSISSVASHASSQRQSLEVTAQPPFESITPTQTPSPALEVLHSRSASNASDDDAFPETQDAVTSTPKVRAPAVFEDMATSATPIQASPKHHQRVMSEDSTTSEVYGEEVVETQSELDQGTGQEVEQERAVEVVLPAAQQPEVQQAHLHIPLPESEAEQETETEAESDYEADGEIVTEHVGDQASEGPTARETPAEAVAEVETEPQPARPLAEPEEAHENVLRQSTASSISQPLSSADTTSIIAEDSDSMMDEEEMRLTEQQYEQLLDEDDKAAEASKAKDVHDENQSAASEYEEDGESEPSAAVETTLTGKDPLADVFPNDAATWAGIKASDASQEESDGELSPPSTELHVAAAGNPALSISTSSALPVHHYIPPSASSSLDPFEYDIVSRMTQNPDTDAESTFVAEQDDVQEVRDLLQAHSRAQSIGLSSPIHLPSSRLSSLNDEAETEFLASLENDSSASASQTHSRAASNATRSSVHSKKTSLSSVNAASISLPLSDSNQTLSTIPQSDSLQSLASVRSEISQPSVSGHSVVVDPPRNINRGGGIPADWASAIAGLRSRKNSEATDDPADAEKQTTFGGRISPASLAEELQRRGSTASIAEIQAEISRSRSSSVVMMENLDEIERTLAELSPRPAQRAEGTLSPAFMPSMTGVLRQAPSVEHIPGYESNSPYEEEAPGTPLAAGNEQSDSSTLPEQEYPTLTSLSHHIVNGTGLPPARPPRRDPQVFQFSEDSNQEPRSPGAASRASTILPYNMSSPVSSPPLPPASPMQGISHVTESASEQPHASKKFAGLRLKGWSGKNNSKDKEKDKDKEPSPKSPKEILPQMPLSPTPGATPAEFTKSPLGGLRGLKFWHKDDHNKENYDVTQRFPIPSEAPLPVTPASAQALEPLAKPVAPALNSPSVGRIPRKSSLASLHATHGSESASPNQSAQQGTFQLSNMSSSSLEAYLSPPATSSMQPPSQARSAPLPPIPAQASTGLNYNNDTDSHQDTLPLATGNGNFPKSNTLTEVSPRFFTSSSTSIPASQSAPGLDYNTGKYPGAYVASARPERTPELGSTSGGRFFDQHGQVSSAPVTPAYSERSVIPSSGRLGKPVKGGAVKANFRLSADSDLSKLLSHMQAIESGEDQTEADLKNMQTSSSGIAGLGLGMPKASFNKY